VNKLLLAFSFTLISAIGGWLDEKIRHSQRIQAGPSATDEAEEREECE